MEMLLHNPVFIFWTAIVLIVSVPVIATHWARVRRLELEARLKHDMIERGMSAEEIRNVLEARMDRRERCAR